MSEWEVFFQPYNHAVGELKMKFRDLRKQYVLQKEHSPIEFVTGRVKPIESIRRKMNNDDVSFEQIEMQLYDIAGIRIMCQFVEDIETIVEMLKNRSDMIVVEERDYILNKKDSGYRSYHVVVEYTVETILGRKKIPVEIQIRTLAMNFWATIEHSFNYKFDGETPKEVTERLEYLAEIAFRMDQEMTRIRKEIFELRGNKF